MRHLFLLLMLLVATLVQAEEIKLVQDGITLNANLESVDGNWPKGPVVLMTHGTLAHNRMEIIETLQQLFQENGVSSLAINLSLGLSDRHGMYACETPHTHRHTDALDEIGIWLSWLKKQGAESVVLMGHSRGGGQTAWFAAERDEPALKRVILVAPGIWSEAGAAAGYRKRYGKPLGSVLEEAESLVGENKGDILLKNVGFIYCSETSATAFAFVSYYRPDKRFNTPHLLQKIAKPVLIFVGSEDRVVKGLEEKIAPLLERNGIELEVIDGADHYFRDLYAEDLVERALEFIAQ